MKVILNRDYAAAPEGHTTHQFKAGQEVEGRIAEMAVRDGAAKKPAKRTPRPSMTKPDAPTHEG